MNWIIEHTPNWNSWLALLLYWLPLALCAFGYTLRSAYKFRNDRAARDEQESKQNGFYMPTITIGTLVGYAVTTVVPIANLFASIFDVAPKVFSGFWAWCDRALNVPLVPKRH